MSMPLLLEYFRELPQRRADEKTSEWSRRFRRGLQQFHRLVAGRYSEGTLHRLLRSAEAEVRQAAVVALGMCGSMTMSQALTRMLHDDDPRVRQFADDALWSIWFRAD